MEITKKGQPVICTPDQMDYFRRLAEKMAGVPCIAYIRKGRTFIQAKRKKKA